MNKSSPYIRYLTSLELLKSKSRVRNLDSTEDLLLNSIMLDDSAGRSIFVGDLLKKIILGSQATLHGRLKNLKTLGYVKLVTQKDARMKRVVPTSKAHHRFEAFSECMKRATKAA